MGTVAGCTRRLVQPGVSGLGGVCVCGGGVGGVTLGTRPTRPTRPAQLVLSLVSSVFGSFSSVFGFIVRKKVSNRMQ